MYVVSSKYVQVLQTYTYVNKLRCQFPTIYHEYTIIHNSMVCYVQVLTIVFSVPFIVLANILTSRFQ